MATIVITPPKKFAIPKVSELWEAREVLYRFGARDVTLRYRQTLLGVVWVLLQPLLTAAGLRAGLLQGGPPPATGTRSPSSSSSPGSSAWNLFSGIITRAQGSLVSNRDLVSKVFFPRMLVPLAVVYSCLVDFLVSIAFLIVLMVIYGVNPGAAVVLAPRVDVHVHPAGQRRGPGHVGADRPLSATSTTSSPSSCSSCSSPAPSPTHPERALQVPGHLRPEPADLAAPGVPVVARASAGAHTCGSRCCRSWCPIAGLRRRGGHLRADGARLRRRHLSRPL